MTINETADGRVQADEVTNLVCSSNLDTNNKHAHVNAIPCAGVLVFMHQKSTTVLLD